MNKKRIVGLLICAAVIVPLVLHNCDTKSKSTTVNKSEIANSKSTENKNNNTTSSSKTDENSSKTNTNEKGTDGKTSENTTSKNVKKDITLIDTKVNKQGNTNGNLANSGSSARQGNWMFYTNEFTSSTSYIYRSMLDGETGLKKLKLAVPVSINVVNDTIYFVSKNYGSIYRLNVGGEENPVVVSNVSANSICVVDDWIYYTEPRSGSYNEGGIFKMKTDGSSKTNIARGTSKFINIEGDFIYYLKNESSSSDIYRANIGASNFEGRNTNETKLSSGNINSFIVDNHCIYFVITSDGLYKMNTDGTNKTKLVSDKDILSFNIKDNFIYYTSYTEPSSIKKISTDGSKTSNITISALEDKKVSFIVDLNIIDDYIFFTVSTGSKTEFCRVKVDGTSSKIIK